MVWVTGQKRCVAAHAHADGTGLHALAMSRQQNRLAGPWHVASCVPALFTIPQNLEGQTRGPHRKQRGQGPASLARIVETLKYDTENADSVLHPPAAHVAVLPN